MPRFGSELRIICNDNFIDRALSIVERYVNILSNWNRYQIEIYLNIEEADFVIRRAWYESTEFCTPEAFKRIVALTIKK